MRYKSSSAGTGKAELPRGSTVHAPETVFFFFFLGAVGVGPVDLEVGAGVRGSGSAL